MTAPQYPGLPTSEDPAPQDVQLELDVAVCMQEAYLITQHGYRTFFTFYSWDDLGLVAVTVEDYADGLHEWGKAYQARAEARYPEPETLLEGT